MKRSLLKHVQHMKRLKKIDDLQKWIKKEQYLVGALAILAVFFFLNVVSAILGYNKSYAPTGQFAVRVTNGMSTMAISEMLHKKKLIKNPSAFRFEARLKGLEKRLQAGVYLVNGGMSNTAIIDTFFKGNIQIARLTVPEGFTVKETAKALETSGFGCAEKFCELARNYAPYDYMQTRQAATVYKAEGFLFPAVYDFPASYTEKDILEMMVKNFHAQMEKEGILAEVERCNLHLRNVVNLAAMVEKEAVFEDEMPLIAGVFQKRLDIGMPIQSDTTIQYILGEQREIITWKDTEIEHPFNTYNRFGLPPGPIASPGLNAIKAALHPQKTDYLYFVAEKDGHHRFTTNYNAHLRAIKDIERGR